MLGAGGGAPKGNHNAWKHGAYSRDAISEKQMIAQLAKLKPEPPPKVMPA